MAPSALPTWESAFLATETYRNHRHASICGPWRAIRLPLHPDRPPRSRPPADKCAPARSSTILGSTSAGSLANKRRLLYWAVPLEFLVLGPREVRAGGRTVPIGGRRQQTILASLLLRANTTVPTADLVASVWDDP